MPLRCWKMSKHVTYGKTFGRFYEAYRMFCRDNSETEKTTAAKSCGGNIVWIFSLMQAE